MTRAACAVLLWAMVSLLVAAPSKAEAAPCLLVTLTGTDGPPPFNGVAGPGTLVRYGDDSNNCGTLLLQFDAGRGTLMRLSQIGVRAADLKAVFLTHMHSDHVEGFSDIAQQRWLFPTKGPKLDVVCAGDVKAPLGYVISCRKFVQHIDEIYNRSGETAQREFEGAPAGGPVPLINVITFQATNNVDVVWTSGDVKVSAIQSAHMPGHVSFRVDTPAGSVVIGGDASNDVPQPPRKTSTSDQVELLSKGVDIIVHTATHNAMAPGRGSGAPPAVYYGKSDAVDLGALAQRTGAKYLMLTHLIPALAAPSLGPWKVPGGPLTEADYRKAVEAGGFTGTIIVGTDLATVRLPANPK